MAFPCFVELRIMIEDEYHDQCEIIPSAGWLISTPETAGTDILFMFAVKINDASAAIILIAVINRLNKW